MHKIARVIDGKPEGAGNSAVCRTLMFAQEPRDAGDDVTLVFDGAGSVLDTIKASGLPLLGDNRGHASLRSLLLEGRQIITI